MAQPGSLAAMSGVPQKLDPYDRASVDRYLQASPNLPGQNIGGNYYPNPYYDPSARSGTQTTMNYGRGGTDIGRGGEGPFYYRAASAAPFQGQSAPQMAPAMGGGAVLAPPSGGGGGEMPSPGDFTKDIGEPPGPYTPQQVDLDVATDTTRGVLYNMLRTDSSYINEARTRAMEAASRRGLSNSSIAAGAGERAAVQSAGPIAQSTAEANLQTKMFNVDATNRARALQFQEANANWRTRQSIALGYYQVEAANARLDKQIAADLNMQQQSFAFAIEQWRLSNLSQVNTMGGVTADQQATASSRINATAAGSPYAINARAATEQQWLNNWSRWA